MTGKLKPYAQTDIELFYHFAMSLTDKTLLNAINEDWFVEDQSPVTAKSSLKNTALNPVISAEKFNSDLSTILTGHGQKKIKRAFSKYRSNKANQTVKINESNMKSLAKIQTEFLLESTNDTIEFLLEPPTKMQVFIDNLHDSAALSEENILHKLKVESQSWSEEQKNIWIRILQITIQQTFEMSAKYRKVTIEKLHKIENQNPFITCLK